MLIKNGTVIFVEEKKEQKCDLLIENGKIVKIGTITEQENKDKEVIDAKGLYVAPGMVDVHVHFRDPGFTYKEDIYTGAKAALKGGYTRVVMMANTKPAIDNSETLKYVLEKGKETDLKVSTCACVSKGLAGKELVDMDTLLKEGAIGFTDDGIPLMDESILREAMKKAAQLNVPISLHEEDPSFITNNGVNAGEAAAHFNIKGSPREAEISLIERDIQIALETGASLNVQHISTKEGVELVRRGKEKGSNIHAEATPHHFSLTEKDCIANGTLAKMNPPLREEADRQAIIEGLKDGTIDIIATDHAPHSKEEKEKDITSAPSGIVGLETALSLGIMNLVDSGKLSLSDLFEKMSVNPAKLYNMGDVDIKEQNSADFVIFDKDKEWTVLEFASKSSNSPFLGKKLKGQVIYTIVDGKIAYKL